jgi:hypothetical protein
MNQRTLITRLRDGDPVAGRRAADDPALRRARVDAILASSLHEPDGISPADVRRPRHQGRSRYRRAATVAVAVVALPGAAVAASVAFGPEEVERGLPAGAEILAGSHPVCHQVEDRVFDCKLTLPHELERPEGATGAPITWTSLMVDDDDRIVGSCTTHADEGSVWRCYVGQAAADQHLLDAALLGTVIEDRCATPAATQAPQPASRAGEPGDAIILCGIHGVFGYSTAQAPDAAAAAPRRGARPAAGRNRPAHKLPRSRGEGGAARRGR